MRRLAVGLCSFAIAAFGVSVAISVTDDMWSNAAERIEKQPTLYSGQWTFYLCLWTISFGFAMLCLDAISQSRRARRLSFVALVVVLPVLIVATFVGYS